MSNTRPPRMDPTFRRRGSIRPLSPSEMLEPSRAPAPPRNSAVAPHPKSPVGAVLRFGSGMLSVLFVGMLALSAVAAYLYHQYERPGPLKVSRVVAVPRGEGRIQIATRLEREGVISSRWTFIGSYMLQNAFGKKQLELRAGDYEIKKHASMADVLETLTRGQAILSKLTIPEGLTSLQIVERVREDPDLTGEVTEIPPEGTLLPDTYRYSKGMARAELIERMQSEMERFLERAWEKRQPDLPIKSPEEAVVFASIVEKETGRADERERVSAVFMNRLRKGMRLQSDPTVIYGIAGGNGTLGRPLTRSDLSGKTDHNTYQIDGLPPTPICNPGRSAIEAALNPATSSDLYFVADGTGGHVFSDTLKEHNEAVRNWRKVEREMRKRQEAEKAADAEPPLPIPSSASAAAAAAASPQLINAGSASSASDSASAASATVPLPVRKPKTP